ncbi:acyl-CoA dehydrogenase family protein [Bacillus sp. B15-48]|uniref:acyl-CoA dehydrogenase family protein n=1 Tax=Bacillus sp. B15-48 TaxID=1548601 RepID=UPI00193F6DBA|nr:acyl-CoA dehydrogenase family protein [Bacillus sp. B15-48]MBM4763318.1 hypothetical protein [Bacillus sp. B15-48]
MDISFTQEQEEYRLRARNWIRENLSPSNIVNQNKNYEEIAKEKLEWEKKLYRAGYAGITWDKEYGGQGLDQVYQIIFNEELGRADAPRGLNLIGTNIVGPTFLEIGTEEQKRRFIPKILAGEEVWCQGFSEPNAGSDLASLSAKAELVGDEWVINGQKIWTSWAQFADYCIVLARTDPDAPKHKGITCFLVPMETPGITVRPLIQMGGERDDFSEVFFDDVKIRKDAVLGEVNNGWQVAMRALSYERGSDTLRKHARFKQELSELVRLSDELVIDKDTYFANSYYRQQLAKAYIEVEILRFLGLKTANKLINNKKLGTETSIQKLYWSEYHQRFGELAMEIQSSDSTYWKEDGILNGKFQEIFIRSRAETIFAGSSQIQKNIIAERILGMPR